MLNFEECRINGRINDE